MRTWTQAIGTHMLNFLVTVYTLYTTIKHAVSPIYFIINMVQSDLSRIKVTGKCCINLGYKITMVIYILYMVK